MRTVKLVEWNVCVLPAILHWRWHKTQQNTKYVHETTLDSGEHQAGRPIPKRFFWYFMVILFVRIGAEMAAYPRHSMLLILVYCSMTSGFMKSQTYLMKPFVDATGRLLCAVDTPSTVVSASTGIVWCGVQCTTSNCPLYQFKADLAQCSSITYPATSQPSISVRRTSLHRVSALWIENSNL